MIDIRHEDSLNIDKFGKPYELGIIEKEGNSINRDMIFFFKFGIYFIIIFLLKQSIK